jgi:hypothetical protein
VKNPRITIFPVGETEPELRKALLEWFHREFGKTGFTWAAPDYYLRATPRTCHSGMDELAGLPESVRSGRPCSKYGRSKRKRSSASFRNPTFRLIGSRTIWERGGTLASRLQSFETELLTQADNLAGLAALKRMLIARAEAMNTLCKAAALEYINMFVEKGMPSRADELRQDRLLRSA